MSLTKDTIEQIIEAFVVAGIPIGLSIMQELTENSTDYSVIQLNNLYAARKSQYEDRLPPLGGRA